MNVYILLDRSGSMSGLWDEAIGSINGYVSNLEDPDTQVSFSVFDSVSYDTLRECKAMDWKEVSQFEASPRGSTPLLDATMRTISKAEEANADRTIIVIMTDGEENASQEVTSTATKEKISAVEGKGWEVVYLGANFADVTDSAKNTGVRFDKSINLVKGKMMEGMLDLSTRSMAYAAIGASIQYTSEDRANLSVSE